MTEEKEPAPLTLIEHLSIITEALGEAKGATLDQYADCNGDIAEAKPRRLMKKLIEALGIGNELLTDAEARRYTAPRKEKEAASGGAK